MKKAGQAILSPVALLVGVLISTSCQNTPISYTEARAIVDRRCVSCHSAKPTSRAFPVAPQAVMLDTEPEMKKYARRIEATVQDGSMPLANISGMTDEERRTLALWVEEGTRIP